MPDLVLKSTRGNGVLTIQAFDSNMGLIQNQRAGDGCRRGLTPTHGVMPSYSLGGVWMQKLVGPPMKRKARYEGRIDTVGAAAHPP